MKISRIPVTSRRPSERFGLFAFIETKRVVLPLKGVECDFAIVSGLAEVSMTQIFRQENEKPLDCEYLFPLPADAAVYWCEADINGRLIRAQVREREEARRLAAEKKAAGFRTALVEAERENLFTLSLGNVQPDDLVIIRLKYFQTLRALAGMPSLEIPFCPGVRYIPGTPLLRSNKGRGIIDDTDQVPDASRITPTRIDALHPDAAYVEVRGRLDGAFVEQNAVSSPSHTITVQRMGEDLLVSLSAKGEVPDRDFVLRWTERNVNAVASRAWSVEKDGEMYALLEVRAPKEAPRERAPVDFYFLVDRSGSMSGRKWNKAAEALQSCVKMLGPADRAMVTLFESRFQDFAEQPLGARELLQDRQFQTLAKLGTAGGTELRPALNHVLKVAGKYSANHNKNLILITDAQIGNESAILELMKTAPDFPVHCFGIDVALNDSLLLALCRQQGGTFHSLNPNDDIEGAVTALGKTLGQPVLLDLQLSEGWELADAVIPNLYAGQIHYLSARSAKDQPLELRGRTASTEPANIQFQPQTSTVMAPYLHWCRSRIQRLLAEGKNRETVALSIKSNLVCPLTAFIAWDDSEKVPIASHQLVQPSLELADASQCLTARFASLRGGRAKAASLLFSRSDPGLTRHLTSAAGSGAVDEQLQEEPPLLRNSDLLDAYKLERELRILCLRARVVDWPPLVESICVWFAEAGEPERARRFEALKTLLEEIRELAKRIHELTGSHAESEIEQARDRIRQLLKAFVDKLPVKK